jgi:hypothetical protein
MAKKRINRDYPLANTPEPTPLYLQTQVVKDMNSRTLRSSFEEADKRRTAQKNAEKANEAAKERADKANRDKRAEMSPEEFRQAAQR